MEDSSKEYDYTPYLTESDRERLEKAPVDCFAYKLSNEQLDFMDKNGYLVVKGLIAGDLCDRVIAEGWERLEAAEGILKKQSSTWAKIPRHGIPDIWHLPSLYDLRQHPLLYSVFAQLLKTPHLVPSIDRVSMKPPCRDSKIARKPGDTSPSAPPDLHTDMNYWWHGEAQYAQFQAGICLADTPVGGGGFFCIPGYHKIKVLNQYKAALEGGDFGNIAVPSAGKVFINFSDKRCILSQTVEVPLERGDVVIWNNHLPHNGGQNTLPDRWRYQAYVRFLSLDGPCTSKFLMPRHKEYQQVVRASMWSGLRPEKYATLNTTKTRAPAEKHVPYHKTPELTDLGKRLFGVKKWDAKDGEEELKPNDNTTTSTTSTSTSNRSRNKRINK